MRRAERAEFDVAVLSADAARQSLVLADDALTNAALTYLLANPNARVADIAAATGADNRRVKELVSTESFRALLAESEESAIAGTYTPEAIKDGSVRVVVNGLRNLNRLIDHLPPSELMTAIQIGAKNLGIGAEKSPLVSININDPRRLSTEELEALVSIEASKASQAKDTDGG